MPQLDYPRKFVAADDVLDSWEKIAPYFDRLGGAPIDTVDQMVVWLENYSELVAAVSEVGTDRHVKMTCQTDDESRKKAFLDFVENIAPQFKVACHALDVRYAQSKSAADLPKDRYAVLDRSIRAGVEVFREQNVPLQTDETKLEQNYQEVSGAQMVTLDGKEQTMQQLGLYAEKTDRGARQAAWEAEWARRAQDVDKLEGIFDQLIALRHKMAGNADCADYREYAFKVKQRFDYSANDCLAFHDAVERAVVPAVRDLQRQRAKTLGLDTLRPWDLAVDVKSRPPLRPFQEPSELCEKGSRVFHRVDPALGDQFDDMNTKGYLDLASRKGKAPGGYQATYDEGRHPFIFMNAVGLQRDVSTLIHEGGHAFHSYAARDDALLNYRSSPIEFAEVASMGMELLAIDFLDEFYDEEQKARAKRQELEGLIGLFPWVATIDAFQHWIYTNPTHDRAARKDQWLSLHQRFGGIADFSGYEDALAYRWHKQLHLFEVPFYYIEYAIAQLGALQVWRNSKDDYAAAVSNYRKALALGGSRPLPELFESAGAKFDFSYDTLAPLVAMIQEELGKLPA
jgi:oligoendopeptidase F